jgi:hypothetical protein
MSDALTNSQIALLCDIGELHLPKLTGDQKRDLEQLISGGYVRPTESRARSAERSPMPRAVKGLPKSRNVIE